MAILLELDYGSKGVLCLLAFLKTCLKAVHVVTCSSWAHFAGDNGMHYGFSKKGLCCHWTYLEKE